LNRSRSLLVLGIIVVLGAGVAWLLSGAGNSGGSSEDGTGDVTITKGAKPPRDHKLADLTGGSVVPGDDGMTFEASVDTSIPGSLENGAMTFRWELTERGQITWIVSASIDVERTASIVATQFDYRSSTIDRSLPGELQVDGGTVTLTLRTEELERFPTSFDWVLKTELDGDRGRSPSAVAEDVVPNDGSLHVGS
jgi:hypothetical protein